jgi:hypothetical protein
MLTRQSKRALGHVAGDTVFSIPELFEIILACLDVRSLLIATGVSQRWRATITGSSRLQRLLFLQPKHQDSDLGRRTQNPLLAETFPPWFTPSTDFRYNDITALPMAENAYRKASFMQPLASWRRLLISQPPVYKLGCWMANYSTRGEPPHDFDWQFRILNFPEGLRMGKLYDLTEQWLYHVSMGPSCSIHWTPHNPATLTGFFWPEYAASDSRVRARDKCGAAVDMILRGQRWHGKRRLVKPKTGPGRFKLKRLKGKEISGPALNYGPENRYKIVVKFAADLSAAEAAEM